jgi:hypothetical protein
MYVTCCKFSGYVGYTPERQLAVHGDKSLFCGTLQPPQAMPPGAPSGCPLEIHRSGGVPSKVTIDSKM